VAQLDEKMDTVIGRTEVDLDGERGTVRLKESNLANAIADSLREMTGTDFAIQNGGGVRASIPKGDITIKDVYTVLPFDNLVVAVEITGKQIWDVLEHGISTYPAAAGQFLQVSNLDHTFDGSNFHTAGYLCNFRRGPSDMKKTYSLTPMTSHRRVETSSSCS